MHQRFIVTFSLILLIAAVGLAAAASSGRAFTYTQTLTIASEHPTVFGVPIDIEGDTAMIGAYYANETQGAAYYYEQVNGQWIEKQELTASDAEEGDMLSNPLIMDGNTALVTALGADYETSSATTYAYERVNGVWIEKQKLPSPIEPSSHNGWIALQGDRAMTSHWGHTRGFVTIYERQNGQWMNVQTIQAPDQFNYYFGKFLTFNGNIAWITDQNNTIILGYEKINDLWTHTITLNDASFTPDTIFWSEGDHLIAIETTANGSQAVAYHRDNGVWTRQQALPVSETVEPGIYTQWFWVDGEGDRIVLSGGIGPSGLDPEEQSRFFSVWEYQNGIWVETQRTEVEPKSTTEEVNEVYAWIGGNTVMASLFTNPLEDAVYVYTDPSLVPTSTPTSTPTPDDTSTPLPPTPTNTPLPDGTTELLVNGGFEIDADANGVPDGWKLKRESDDKQKCNTAEKAIAFEGACIFQFKGGDGERSKLQQDINLAARSISLGDTLTLNGQVWAKGDVDSKVTLKVKYASLPTDKLNVNISSTGKQWTTFSALQPSLSISVAETPSKIILQLKHESPSGKVRYDAISLTRQSNALIPLGVSQ
jgi:hypothetical protein